MIIEGKQVYLRYIQEQDIDTLLLWENNAEVQEVSDDATVYSKKDIENFVHSHQDIYLQKQLRLMICRKENDEALGCIDLFQFDAHHARAGVGILIYDQNDRNSGFGTEAIQLLVNYCNTQLKLNQLFCNVQEHNVASIKLFQRANFTTIGLKKEWNRTKDGWENEFMMQLLLK